MTFPVSLHCTGRKLAYARVSTADQHLDMQVDALHGAGCDQLFHDHGVSGTRAKRPGLDELLDQARAGDMVMVYRLDRLGRSVQHLSNLLTHFNDTGIHFCSLSEGINTATPGGRLIYHVISAIAEFEREIIVERTVSGMEAARRRGKRIGRPRSLSPEQVVHAQTLFGSDGITTKEIAGVFGVSRITIDRALKRLDRS